MNSDDISSKERSDDMGKNHTPTKKQKTLGAFFKQVAIITNKDGSKLQFERTLSPPKTKPREIDPKLVCKGCFKKGFITLKGLKGHESSCKAAMKHDIEKEQAQKQIPMFKQTAVSSAFCKAIARDNNNNTDKNPSVLLSSGRNESNNTGNNVGENVGNQKKNDGQKGNRGSSVRCRHNNLFKYKHLIACQSWIEMQKNEGKDQNVTNYCRSIFPPN